MPPDSNSPRGSTSILRWILFGLTLLAGALVIYDSLLQSNSLWSSIRRTGFLPVSIHVARQADYSSDPAATFNPVDLRIIVDILKDSGAEANGPSGRLPDALATPLATLVPTLLPNSTPTPGLIALPSAIPTLHIPLPVPTDLLPNVVKTKVPEILPDPPDLPDLPDLPDPPPVDLPDVLPDGLPHLLP